ncbi:MAG: histidine kinase [Sporocytophaga sp.]|uniref:histidine kinase n=1 Tax=Sporocytophaga sp. TaxID=2231183 RepID=UPI001B1118EC|nr:histidine kinase [Sporocytophaga sp.]MBO9701929.1 histidine kinase [Sporocytophaga sp.]
MRLLLKIDKNHFLVGAPSKYSTSILLFNTIFSLVKEANKLRIISKCYKILESEERDLDAIFNEIVLLLPEAWEKEDFISARIKYSNSEFYTPNFLASAFQHSAEFLTTRGFHGYIEVALVESAISKGEVYFEEELDFLNIIANTVCSFLNRRYEKEDYRKVLAYHTATINNTIFLIWSVDKDHKLTYFNKPFEDIVLKRYGVLPKRGALITENIESQTEVINRWTENYDRALKGEAFKVQIAIGDEHIEYSINPIVEDGAIIGVTIFGEDISERVRLEQEMLFITKRLAETRLMALRSSMNPHFIFNVLNSIQYYILQKDPKKAVIYLSKFSKLMRQVLDSSVQNKGLLSRVIEMTQLYIELESLRLENKFEYLVQVDSHLEIDTIELPSLLVQPYLENAIIHGLAKKEEKGMLKVSFKQEDNDMLLVEVEDNGIGRKAAEVQRFLDSTEHKSLGVKLTEERLRIHNGENEKTVDIIDLSDNCIPSGTLVRIWIKI